MIFRATRKNRVIFQTLATALVLPFALPLWWIASISFQGQGPLANYSAVLTQTPFFQFLTNSAIISASTIAIVFVCTMLASFALAKLRVPGREYVFLVTVSGMMLPVIALTVPLFQMVRNAQLFNNYLAVILPLCAVILPMTILLTRNFIRGVPDQLLEAAKIDGATSFTTLYTIVIPLAKPIIAVIIVWAFLNSWNEFLLPLLFLQDPTMQAITQVPTYFTSTYGSNVPRIFSALMLMCLPVIIAYLAFQKFFERGLTAGALK